MKKLLLTLIFTQIIQYSFAQISITSFAAPYTQNFDSLSSDTIAATTHAMNLAGWAIFETGGGAQDDDLYKVNHGNSNTGNTYSYGELTSPERALGGLASGTNLPKFGCAFINNTGSDIVSVSISFVGEQWRSGDLVYGNLDSLLLEYSTTATAINDSITVWNNAGNLTLVSPYLDSLISGALVGNNPLYKTNMNGTIIVNVPNGSKLLLRWRDINRVGSDDGLSVDNLSVTFTPVNNNKPVLIGLLPVDGAVTVPIATNAIYAKFDKPIAIGTGNVTIYNLTDVTSQTIAAANCSVVATDSGMISGVVLLAEKDYAVQFDSTLFTTVGGVDNCYGIYDNTTWDFDTKTPIGFNNYFKNNFSLAVNNTETNINVLIQSTNNSLVNIEITDATGKIMISQKNKIVAGENKININNQSLSKGIYFIRVYNVEMKSVVKFTN